MSLAQRGAHPFSLCFALSLSLFCHHARRESDTVAEISSTLAALAAEQAFPQQAVEAAMYQAWARSEQGEDQIATLRQTLDLLLAAGMSRAIVLEPLW